MKSPGLAAVLSFFWPGLGQIYNGQIIKGVFLVLLQALNWYVLTWILIGFVTAAIVWLYGMFDAYSTAQRINRQLAPPGMLPRF
jgi:TM2 domain-containing membrane protein YozV